MNKTRPEHSLGNLPRHAPTHAQQFNELQEVHDTAPLQPTDYISNPFLVMIRGLERLFAINQTSAVWILAASVLIGIPYYIFDALDSDSPHSGTSELVLILIGVTLYIATLIATIFLWGATNYIAYKTMLGEKVSFKESLRATKEKFSTILLIGILVFLRIIGGLILFIIPGIRANTRYSLVLMAMFDEKLGANESLTRSKQLSKGHLLELYSLNVISDTFSIITYTLRSSALTISYPQLKALEKHSGIKPPVHWTNYLVLVLSILATIFFVGVVALLIAVAATY